jgi:hypothetical protein
MEKTGILVYRHFLEPVIGGDNILTTNSLISHILFITG